MVGRSLACRPCLATRLAGIELCSEFENLHHVCGASDTARIAVDEKLLHRIQTDTLELRLGYADISQAGRQPQFGHKLEKRRRSIDVRPSQCSRKLDLRPLCRGAIVSQDAG